MGKVRRCRYEGCHVIIDRPSYYCEQHKQHEAEYAAQRERYSRKRYNKYTRNTMDVSAIPVLQELTNYPVLADPSHAAGVAHHVTSVGLAAVAAGAQGLMVEIHDHPEAAFVDGAQALTPAQFTELADKARAIHEIVRG